MEQITHLLDPLIEQLPPELQEYWPLLIFVPALIILLPIAWYQRRALRALIVRPFRPIKLQPKLDEDLGTYPPPSFGSMRRRLLIEGVPVRLRLVVLAPAGIGETIDQAGIKDQLNRVLWGLGALVDQDQPQLRVWPPQLSSHGFPAVFHRLVRKPEPDGEPSRWVLVAGVTPPRPRTVLLGLGLWTDEPTPIGRLSMEPRDWAMALHVQNVETEAGAANFATDEITPLAPEGPRSEESTPLPQAQEGPPGEETPPGGNQGSAAPGDQHVHASHTSDVKPSESHAPSVPEENQQS